MIPLGWKYYPALKTLLPLACGIVLSRLLTLPVGWLLAALALATAWLAIEIRRGGGNAIPAVPSIVLVSGALLYAVGPGSATTGLEGLHIADVEIIGRVVAEPVHRKNRIEYVVDCDSLLYRNSSVRPGAKALLRLYDTATDLRELPAYGDRISVIVTLTVPAPPSMPGSFDYAGYLRSRGIEFICSAGRASSICTIRRNDLSAIERIVLPIRRSAREFAREMVGGEEGDIVRALLLGEREDIDPSTREAFVRTGTVHVLAVSGLHVGVIAIGLFVLVSWIPNRSAQTLIYALAIALYVAVAGAGPSILRAAIMAVAFMTARATERIPRSLNTLSLAALVMLLARPESLFDVGFQLSFASVAGIIMLQAPLNSAIVDRLRPLRRPLPKRIVELLLLSFSAQMFTLPLMLHYFGRVSTIALPLNLLVVPLMSIALGAAATGLLIRPISAWFGGTAYLAVAAAERLVVWGGGVVPETVTGSRTGIVATLLLSALGFYFALGRSPSQLLLRGLTFVAAIFCAITIDHAADPLGAFGERYLCLIPTRDGMAVVTSANDTLTVHQRRKASSIDSLPDDRWEALRERLGARVCRIVTLDSLSVDGENGLIVVGDAPREYAMRRLPVLLSLTGNRRIGLVRFGAERLLQIPMRGTLERAVVLRYDASHWERIEWD